MNIKTVGLALALAGGALQAAPAAAAPQHHSSTASSASGAAPSDRTCASCGPIT